METVNESIPKKYPGSKLPRDENGDILPGPGRPKGSIDKAKVNARRAIADFVDDNAERLTGWLDKIAEKDPKAAFDSFMSVVEYHIPKLSRTDNTNTNIGIVQIVMEAAKQYHIANTPQVIDSQPSSLPSPDE